MLRRHLLPLLLALVAIAPAVHAQSIASGSVLEVGPTSCATFDQADVVPADLIGQKNLFDCSPDRLAGTGKHLWILITFDASARSIANPVIRATMSRHSGVTTYITYDDGSVRQDAYPIGALRQQWRSPNRMSFPIASDTGSPPRTLLMGVAYPADTKNWDDLELLSESVDSREHIDGIIRSSLLIGIMIGLLLVNAFLFAVLRAKFLAVHFGMLLTAFLYATSWSGLIFPLMPGLTVEVRSDFNHIVIALTFSLACLLVRELCEPEKLGRFWRAGLVASALLSIVATLIVIPFDSPDQPVNFQLLIIALSATPVMIFGGLFHATVRGSRAAGLQLVGWSGLGVIIVGNLLHDSGIMADLSILNYGFAPALLLEVTMTTVVVTLHVMKLRRQRDELDAERNQLSAIASTDYLTALPNRRAFIEQFDNALATKMDRISNLALICVDIDHFKRVNDVYGHDMGDRVLVAFGEILKDECRALDYCARFGGEEFSILVASNSVDGPMRFAERLRQRIEEHRFPIPETITASLGVVHLESDPANSFDEYYKRADAALYKAKQTGRNRVCMTNMTIQTDDPANDTTDGYEADVALTREA